MTEQEWHQQPQRPPEGIVEIGTTEQLGELYAALGAAQGQFALIVRTVNVTIRTREGVTYSFSYAPLEVLMAATRPALTEHKIAVLTPIVHQGQDASVVVILAHAGGGRLMATYSFTPRPDIKDMAGQITYLRRYGYSAMLNLAADDDDDDRTDPIPPQQARQQAPARPAQPANGSQGGNRPPQGQAPRSAPPGGPSNGPWKPTAKPGEKVVENSPDWERHLVLVAEGKELEVPLANQQAAPGMPLVTLQSLDHALELAIANRRAEVAKGPADQALPLDQNGALPPYGDGGAGLMSLLRDQLFDVAENKGIQSWRDDKSGEIVDVSLIDWETITIDQARALLDHLNALPTVPDED